MPEYLTESARCRLDPKMSGMITPLMVNKEFLSKEILFMLTDIRSPSCFGRLATVVFLLLCITSQPSNAIEGFYAGGAIGGEYADVDFKKSVGRILPDMPVAFTSAADNAQGGVSSFKVVLGHRWNLPGRTYLSGEVDAALRLDNSVTGFLEGAVNTQNPDANVFPGNWYL